jgi:acetoin:2,6-dichlorophenolindophenol oxidoreductase subunit beta
MDGNTAASAERRMSVSQAYAEAMAEEMRRDEGVIVWGVDVGAYGGAFAATKGLYDEFGGERVIDMPISEAGFTGLAVGAAAAGLRPVVELQFSDWITLSSDQLINQAAKMRYMFGGHLSIPLVLRAPSGGYLSAAAQHSDSFESLFAHVPGLKVIAPSTAADAKGLMKAAIRDNNPVIVFEHKKLYSVKGPVPEGEHLVDIGVARVARQGTDVSVITYGYVTQHCLQVAETLADEGVDVEVVDLRSISPLDVETVLASVAKTTRAVVVQEAWRQFSVGSEVSALIAENLFGTLSAAVERVGAKHAPVPFSPPLEEQILPQPKDLEEGIRRALK